MTATPAASAPVLQRNFPSDAEWRMIMQTASHVWKSGMANDYGVKTESGVILVMLKGWELGLALMASLDHVRIIHGRVSISAECQQALVLARVPGARFKWLADGRNGDAKLVAHRPGHEDITVSYTIQDAQQGGVAGKNPTYRTWPANLLRAGAMRNACRMQFADVILGLTGFDDDDVIEPETPVPMLAPAAPPSKQLESPKAVEQPKQIEAKPSAALPPKSEPEVVEAVSQVVEARPMREPGDDSDDACPPDELLPFDDGRYAGKMLSDLSGEKEFRMMINGFRNAAKAAAENGDAARETDRLGWADLVVAWANWRGINIE